MHTATKIWLIIASILVISGLTLFTAVMYLNHWDFSKLSTRRYVTNTYTVTENFRDISIRTDTADILFVPAEDGKCTVVCYEQENLQHSVDVQNNVLAVHCVDARKWYEHIGIHLDTPKVTVHLPQEQYASLFIIGSTGDIEIPQGFQFDEADISLSTGDVEYSATVSGKLSIKGSTGDIQLADTSAGELELSVSTGTITVSQVVCLGDAALSVTTGKTVCTNLTCNNLKSIGSTGDILLQNVISKENYSVTRTTGDICLDGADAAELYLETSTGDVTGRLLSEKVFLTQTSTGDIQVPQTVSGGKCQIHTSTGDIAITIGRN